MEEFNDFNEQRDDKADELMVEEQIRSLRDGELWEREQTPEERPVNIEVDRESNINRTDERKKGFVSENVVNLSDHVLTDMKIKVLFWGLNFCPTPKEIDTFELARDILEFGGKMKCKAYFSRRRIEHRESGEETPFKLKSKWTPDLVDPALDLFLKTLERRIFAIEKNGSNYRNLGKEGMKGGKES